jgi:hypothetical protein
MLNISKIERLSHTQRGVALVASLVFLMILTILGISVMTMTTLEERMAFNTQERYKHRQLSEATVLYAARDDLLPPPEKPGETFEEFDFSSIFAGLPEAHVVIAFTEYAPINNLVPVNPAATYLSAGGAVAPSGERSGGIPIFTITVDGTTKAGTTGITRGGFFFIPMSSLMN